MWRSRRAASNARRKAPMASMKMWSSMSPERAGVQRRPTLGRLPWLAFFRRDRAFRFAVRFDMTATLPRRSSRPVSGSRYPETVERLSIVGLPNAGKSSLFNALTGGAATVAAHPFSTTETNVGVAEVPDRRVEVLGELSHSKKLVHTNVEFVDIAALVAGAAAGEGLGTRFLGGIRAVDAMVLVLRAFEDPNVVGGTEPLDDLHTLELELVLADVATLESQLDKRRRAAKGDKSLAGEIAVMEQAPAQLEGG